VLLLDYDGTLAPFHSDRMQAMLYEGIAEQLDRLARLDDTTVALVSGRPVAEIQQLTGIEHLLIAGTHGFELYRPGIGITKMPLPPGVEDDLDEARRAAEELVGGYRAERKIATVALHVRGLEPAEANRVSGEFRVVVEPMTGEHLEVRNFNGGVELRVRGRDKGIAITEILAELPPSDLVVYIGDDDTDEDAFKALPPHGIGIKVGNLDTPTAARGRLPSCAAVLQFLSDWIAIKT
jgi:trehalose-phosphatase